MYTDNNIKPVNEDNGVWELCPKCEAEVFILKDQVSNCPNCGERIIPCSMCIECIASGDYCPVWEVNCD